MVEMIDGPMITRLVENHEEFNKYAQEKFNKNEASKDDDHHDDGFAGVDLERYKEELRDVMTAVAEGIGNTPVNVMLEEGSFLSKVYEVEVLRIQKEEEEEQKKIKEEKNKEKEKESLNLDNNNNNNNNNNNVVSREKRLKKKSSFNLMNFCACSGKQFVIDA